MQVLQALALSSESFYSFSHVNVKFHIDTKVS